MEKTYEYKFQRHCNFFTLSLLYVMNHVVFCDLGFLSVAFLYLNRLLLISCVEVWFLDPERRFVCDFVFSVVLFKKQYACGVLGRS